MGKLSKYLFGIMAAAMLAGCSDDAISPDDPGTLGPDDGEGFFMALNIQMPGGSNGSRSETNTPELSDTTTSTGGIEYGQDYENNVTSALIILAAKDAIEGKWDEFGFIAAGTVLNNRITNVTSTEGCKQYKATARLQKDNLEKFYAAYGNTSEETGSHEVYVFVFCNPTAELTGIFDGTQNLADGKPIAIGKANWMEETCSVIQGKSGVPNKNIGIWGSNSFLMNNVVLATRKLPGQLLSWEKFNSADTPFHLSSDNEGLIDNSATESYSTSGGAVRVERSVARFDYRDGSPQGSADNTYPVLKYGETGNEVTVVEVELQKMCLVNMSNNFYYLPRVSSDGTPSGEKFAYCGPERPWDRQNGVYTGGNYVVGPYWEPFGIDDLNVSTYTSSTYFNFPFFSDDSDDELVSFENGNWDVVEINDVLNGTPDNYTGLKSNPYEAYEKGSFRIWRYVTENVIPAPESNQRNANSTGVVFKGRIKGVAPQGITEEVWDGGSIANIANCLNGKSFTYEGHTVDSITGNSYTDPILYYFDGHLYMGWRHIRQAAIQASVTVNTSGEIEINRSNSLYKAVFGDGAIPWEYTYTVDEKPVTKPSVYMDKDGNPTEIKDSEWDNDWNITWKNPDEDAKVSSDTDYLNYLKSADYAWLVWDNNSKPALGSYLDDMRTAITSAGITIYQSSLDEKKGGSVAGYYCYYYYWNRHNDNGIAGTMGPMEFAVVRNNVYKLTVDKISRLGHPRIPDNDPDNPTPDTPDETDKIYLDVQVHIIPWVVRVNSIVF